MGSPTDCGIDCSEKDPRDPLGPESHSTGLSDEDVGGKGSGGNDGFDGFEAVPPPPRKWICAHCTEEHLLQTMRRGEL